MNINYILIVDNNMNYLRVSKEFFEENYIQDNKIIITQVPQSEEIIINNDDMNCEIELELEPDVVQSLNDINVEIINSNNDRQQQDRNNANDHSNRRSYRPRFNRRHYRPYFYHRRRRYYSGRNQQNNRSYNDNHHHHQNF